MASVQIKLDGFKELAAELVQYGPRVAKNGLRSSNFAGAMVVVEAAKATSAFHDVTGQLRKSIWAYRRKTPDNIATHAVGAKGLESKKLRESRKAFKAAGFTLGVGPYIYGRFIEFGTSKMRARPFLRPAFYASVGGAIEAIRAGLAKAIDRAVRRRGP